MRSPQPPAGLRPSAPPPTPGEGSQSPRPAVLAAAAALALAALAAGCSQPPKTVEQRGRAAGALWREGVQTWNEGKVDAAIATLQKAAEAQPTEEIVRLDLGRFLLFRGMSSDQAALRLFQEGSRLREDGKVDDARRKEDEGERLHRSALADFRLAHGHLLWVSEVWPHEANVFYWLSQTSAGLGDYEAAEGHLERAIEVGDPVGSAREKWLNALGLLRKARVQSERLRERS